jgi:membrane-associated protein
MTYSKFLAYNVIGGIAWCVLFIYGGYFFGNIPVVQNNFSIVILAIVFLSILPGIIKFLSIRFRKSIPGSEEK